MKSLELFLEGEQSLADQRMEKLRILIERMASERGIKPDMGSLSPTKIKAQFVPISNWVQRYKSECGGVAESWQVVQTLLKEKGYTFERTPPRKKFSKQDWIDQLLRTLENNNPNEWSPKFVKLNLPAYVHFWRFFSQKAKVDCTIWEEILVALPRKWQNRFHLNHSGRMHMQNLKIPAKSIQNQIGKVQKMVCEALEKDPKLKNDSNTNEQKTFDVNYLQENHHALYTRIIRLKSKKKTLSWHNFMKGVGMEWYFRFEKLHLRTFADCTGKLEWFLLKQEMDQWNFPFLQRQNPELYKTISSWMKNNACTQKDFIEKSPKFLIDRYLEP